MKHSRDGRPGWQQASAQLVENPSKTISISVELGMMSSVAGRSYYDLKRMKGQYYSTSDFQQQQKQEQEQEQH
jgi:hypothetical protein